MIPFTGLDLVGALTISKMQYNQGKYLNHGMPECGLAPKKKSPIKAQYHKYTYNRWLAGLKMCMCAQSTPWALACQLCQSTAASSRQRPAALLHPHSSIEVVAVVSACKQECRV